MERLDSPGMWTELFLEEYILFGGNSKYQEGEIANIRREKYQILGGGNSKYQEEEIANIRREKLIFVIND